MEAEELTLRPVRPADRDRVSEITATTFGGDDYVPSRFDDWVADPASTFQAAELDGVLVGFHRLRPIGRGLLLYEGMRVDPERQGQGIGRSMLAAAIDESRQQGFREMRLITANPRALRLFEMAGFQRRAELTSWRAGRIEGGDPARVPSAQEAIRLAAQVRGDPAFPLYGGVSNYWQAPVDLDDDHFRELAEQGLLRVNGGAVAGLSPIRTDRVGVNFVFGSGAALQDLLTALRFEADADGMAGVWVATPPEHPAADDFRAVGYDLAIDSRFYICALELRD
ncbi:MAG TPA: GNAT family N-acetyltransferase [Candidatus Dormibacteraeota bacterium]